MCCPCIRCFPSRGILRGELERAGGIAAMGAEPSTGAKQVDERHRPTATAVRQSDDITLLQSTREQHQMLKLKRRTRKARSMSLEDLAKLLAELHRRQLTA